MELKVTLFDSLIGSIILYGLNTLNINNAQLKKLQTFYSGRMRYLIYGRYEAQKGRMVNSTKIRGCLSQNGREQRNPASAPEFHGGAGCGSQFPGQFPGEFPGTFPGKSDTAAKFPGRSPGNFPRNAFPGNFPNFPGNGTGSPVKFPGCRDFAGNSPGNGCQSQKSWRRVGGWGGLGRFMPFWP